MNGYPSFYPRIALVAPSPEVTWRCRYFWEGKDKDTLECDQVKSTAHILKGFNYTVADFMDNLIILSADCVKQDMVSEQNRHKN